MIARGGNVDGNVLGGIGITLDDAQESEFQFVARIHHEVNSSGVYSEVLQRKQQKGLKTPNPLVTRQLARQPTISGWWTKNGLGASQEVEKLLNGRSENEGIVVKTTSLRCRGGRQLTRTSAHTEKVHALYERGRSSELLIQEAPNTPRSPVSRTGP